METHPFESPKWNNSLNQGIIHAINEYGDKGSILVYGSLRRQTICYIPTPDDVAPYLKTSGWAININVVDADEKSFDVEATVLKGLIHNLKEQMEIPRVR